VNSFANRDLLVAGQLLGGTPERPLTRNCYLAVGAKNYPGKDDAEMFGSKRQPARLTPLYIGPEAVVRSYTRDFSKARLVIRRYPLANHPELDPPIEGVLWYSPIRPKTGSQDEKELIERWPEKKRLMAFYDSLHGIDCYVAKGATVENVEFDQLRPGGIMYHDEATRKAMKNIIIGPNSKATADNAYHKVDEPIEEHGHY
jgi:hypothetical protein